MTSELVRGDGLFPPAAYAREDDSSDGSFYASPRKVVHIDDGAIAALGGLYADVLPTGGRLLDLMSSWRSHLPAGFAAGEGLFAIYGDTIYHHGAGFRRRGGASRGHYDSRPKPLRVPDNLMLRATARKIDDRLLSMFRRVRIEQHSPSFVVGYHSIEK